MKETLIQKNILEMLRPFEIRGKLYFFRSGVGAVKTATGSFFKTGKRGNPDISVILKGGLYVGLEVKNEKGRQSQIQKEAQRKIEEIGGKYHIVRSSRQAFDVINIYLNLSENEDNEQEDNRVEKLRS